MNTNMEARNDIFADSIPKSVPDIELDLVESFNKLLLNVSGDSDKLNKLQEMLSTEIERASDGNSVYDDAQDSTSNADMVNELDELVTLISPYFNPDDLNKHQLERELHDLYQSANANKRYIWLTNTNKDYEFGGRTYYSKNIGGCKAISSLMDHINSDLDLQLDSCLVIRYVGEDDALSLHQDDESILDDSHPIVVTPFGQPRTVQFWSSKQETSGTLIKEVMPLQGDLLIMKEGCQKNLWHKVLKKDSSVPSGIRYALSFRKLKTTPTFPDNVQSSTPRPKTKLKKTRNGFEVHPSRLIPANFDPAPGTPLRSSDNITAPEEAYPPTLPSPTEAPAIPSSTLQSPSSSIPPRTSSSSNPPSRAQPPSDVLPPSASSSPPSLINNPPRVTSNTRVTVPKHLIVGDSLVKGLQVPGSTSICKGGIGPNKLLQLILSSTDVLRPENYLRIRSVTVIVGTNALHVDRAGHGMPLLAVVSDYERLVHELVSLFPNARVGLYNVIPRAHRCMESVDRIKDFNNIFQSHVVPRLRSVYWINNFWEFLDNRGFIRSDLYGRSGVHLKDKGKAMMAWYIENFQNSYY